MSEFEPEFPLTYTAAWLGEGTIPVPASAQRAIAVDDARAAQEAAEFEAERADVLEGRAMVARMAGRDTSLQAVLQRAERAAKADDYHAERRELRGGIADGSVHVMDRELAPAVSRSAYPGSQYEADATIARWRDDKTWFAQYLARHDYPAAVEAARSRSTAGRDHLSRSAASGRVDIQRWVNADFRFVQ